MNFVGLWIRLISLGTICLLGVVLVLCEKKRLSRSVKVVIILVVVGLFTFGMVDTGRSIVYPKIETFVGVFEDFSTGHGINFFSTDYCFDVDGEKVYVGTDAVSSRILLPNGIVQGCTYEVSYETEQDLIVAIQLLG